MIAKGTPHRRGAVLARYLITPKSNEQTQLWELRGFTLTDIVDAFRSVQVMARATKCTAPFFHVYVRNREGETLTSGQWEYAANRIESILGLTGQPRAIAFHTSKETGDCHMHLAFSRINEETLTAKPLPYFKHRLKIVSRELEKRFGLTPVPSQRRSLVGYAPTRAEEAQAYRNGIDIRETRDAIRRCFEAADCGRSFQLALSEHSLVLARGERRDFVVVDREGGMHALGKRLLGVSAAEIRTCLADLRPGKLPTVDQARRSGMVNPRPVSEWARRMDHGVMALLSSCGRQRAVRDTPETCGSETEQGWAAGRETGHHLAANTSAPVITDTPVCTAEITFPVPLACDAGSAHDPSLATETTEVKDGVPTPFELVPIYDQCENVDGIPPPSTREILRQKFRSVIKQLAGKPPAPAAKPRRRRREEAGRSLKAVAVTLLRRISRTPVFDPLDLSWNAFTWLQLWEYNHSSEASPLEDCTSVSSPISVPHL